MAQASGPLVLPIYDDRPSVESDSFPPALDVVADDEESPGMPDPGAFACEIRERDPNRLQFASSQLHVPTLEDVFHVGGKLDPFPVHVLARNHVSLYGEIPSTKFPELNPSAVALAFAASAGPGSRARGSRPRPVGARPRWRNLVGGGGGRRSRRDLDARSNGRPTLLVAFHASITSDSRDTVFAGALSVGLVASLARCSDWVTSTFLAGVPMRDFLGLVPIIAFIAVVAVSARRVVAAVQTNAAGSTT